MVPTTKLMDLFNNPMIDRARAALSDEDKKRYQAIGHAMFKDIDFTSENYDLSATMKNAAEYVISALESGQHPSTLEEEELDVMAEIEGPEWYKKFGYCKKDLKEIATVPQNIYSISRTVGGATESKETGKQTN
jgi:hypothetical protein